MLLKRDKMFICSYKYFFTINIFNMLIVRDFEFVEWGKIITIYKIMSFFYQLFYFILFFADWNIFIKHLATFQFLSGTYFDA